MIEWTEVGTVQPLTGSTVHSGSSFSSYSGSISETALDGVFSILTNTDTGSESGSSVSSFSSYTSRGESGATTYHSHSWSETYTAQWGATQAYIEVTHTDNSGPTTYTYSHSSSTASSSSSSTTTIFTAIVQTSTTATAISYYSLTKTISGEGEQWTTSLGDGILFYTTTNSFSKIDTFESSRSLTYQETTYLDETVTLSAVANTIVQADTLNGDIAEIIYAITSPVAEVTALSAATEMAVSGTRLTLEPFLVTAAKTAVSSPRPESFLDSSEQTSLLTYDHTKTTSEAATSVLFQFFPPETETYTRQKTITANSTAGTNTFEFQIDHTYGGATDTFTVRSFDLYSTTVSQQIGSLTFAKIAPATTTYTVIETSAAAVTSSTSPDIFNPHTISIWFGLYTTLAAASASTIELLSIEANMALPTARATIGQGEFPQQKKYGTTGVVLGSSQGQWITANETSGLAPGGLYVSAGRSAKTLFPFSDSNQTIIGDSITWQTTASAILSIDGATSKKTTTSASFGVAGTTQTTELISPIGNFGGRAASAETFVQNATPGVYKNRIDGQTTQFDGAASVISNTSESLSMWFPIKDVRGLATSTNANPIVWTEARNSMALRGFGYGLLIAQKPGLA